MRTVLHTIDTWGPGGAETVFVDIASGLDGSRFRSRAAVLGSGWVYDALAVRGFSPALLRTGRGPVDFALLTSLWASARRERAQLIQSHLLTTGLYGALVARLLGLPAVATFHGMVDVSPNDRWARVKLRLIAANTTRVVFVSSALRRHFVKTLGISEQRTAVVPNGIDPERFFPAPHQHLRAELHFPDSAIVVGAVGNVRPAKGYDELLRVADRLRAGRTDVRFVVAGAPGQPLLDALLAQRRQLRLEDRVIFLGFRPDIPAVLNGLDLYLSTSTSEGFSLSTVQAMACGLGVVATRSGGPEEIVTDGVDGVLVPVGDAAAIASVVEGLACDADRRRRLGAAGRRAVTQRFTKHQMIAAYEAIYDEAFSSAPPKTLHRLTPVLAGGGWLSGAGRS